MDRLSLLTRQAAGLSDLAYLFVRVMMGVIFINAARGDFEMGFPTLVQNYESLGIPLPELASRYTAFGQVIFGILLIVGLATRLAAAGLVVVMLGAVFFVHLEEGLNGYGYPLMLAVALVALIFTGPGKYSADHALVTRAEQHSAAAL